MIRIILLMGLLSQVVVAQETDFSSIQTNWRVCATCHGNNGEGKPGFPSLNKLTSEYVIEHLPAIGAMFIEANKVPLLLVLPEA